MRRLKFLFLFLIFVTTFLLIYSVLYPNIIIDNRIINLNEEYTPDLKIYNLFGDLTDMGKITGSVNTEKVGKYKINCQIKYLFFRISKDFVIEVIDSESPTITLHGSNPSLVCPNKIYEEEGYVANDNYDRDITDKVIITEIDNNIFYSVEDSSGNSTMVKRTIKYKDQESPSITLNGGDSISIYLGDKYTEFGYTATDNCDGDITSNVISTGYVDTHKIGSYTLTYEVSDSSGNKTIKVRNVHVKKKPTYYGNGVIYLTFDDGPSYLTKEVLDILHEENIKATFFVTNADENTKRAYELGHTIALHSYTHDYSYIYANSENYFDDLNKLANKVYSVIGIYPKIVRFPGGSSNTISRNFSSGIMSYLTKEVLKRGYVYFDWNIDANDAGSDVNNSTNIYYNVVNNLSHNKTNIVLMHDSSGHTATVSALRDIIKFGKEHGYSFKAITDDTPVVIHNVNN